MPTYVKGNVFNGNNDVIVITTNGCIDSKGELVMGRGAALEAKRRYPNLPRIAAQEIKKYPYLTMRGVYIYRFLTIPNTVFGLFQVKYDWREKADLVLIGQSALRLRNMAQVTPKVTYALNFPGIGNGKLDKKIVMLLLEDLPENVIIYELP